MRFNCLRLPKIKRLNPWLLALLLLTIWGFILRIYALGYQSLWNDEAATINAASGMLEHGLPILPSGYIYSRSILNTGIIALCLSLFGSSEFAARFPSVLFGTLTIPLVFFFARKIGNEKIALIAAIITALSMVEIAWSRQARMYQQLQFFYILSLYLFYQFTQTKSKRYLILTILSTVCATLSHEFGFTLILIFLIYAFLPRIRKSLDSESLLRKKTITLLLCIVCIVGLIILGEVKFKVFSNILGVPEALQPSFYLWYLISTLVLISVLALVWAVISFEKKSRTALLAILISIVLFCFLSVHLGLWGRRYFYFLLPIVFILFSYAVVYLSGLTRRLKFTPILSMLVTALLLGLTFFYGFVFIPRPLYYHFDPTIQQPDFKRAYGFIKADMGENDVVIHTWTAPGRFYLDKIPDYWLYFDIQGCGECYLLENDITREIYTGAPVIRDLNRLKSVINGNERGWIVIDSYAWNSLANDSRDFIAQSLNYYEEGSSQGEQGDIMVYGWGD